MADYIAIANSQIEPKAPVTSELMNQLRDNPEAIAEGATGAPRVVSRALGLTYLSGSGSYGVDTIDSVDMGEAGPDIIVVNCGGIYSSTDAGQMYTRLQGSTDNVSFTNLALVCTSTSSDAESPANGSVIYDGNGGTDYRYYRLVNTGSVNKTLEGSVTAVFIGGDTT